MNQVCGPSDIEAIGVAADVSDCATSAVQHPPGEESVGVEFEQDLSAAIGFQGTINRLLELVEGIDMLDSRGHRPPGRPAFGKAPESQCRARCASSYRARIRGG